MASLALLIISKLALLIIANLALVQTHTLSSIPFLLCCCQVCACLAPCIRKLASGSVCVQAHCLQHPSSALEIANLCDQAEGVASVVQVFGLLDMHEQLDGHMSVLSEVLSNTNSGSLLRVGQQCLSDHAA